VIHKDEKINIGDRLIKKMVSKPNWVWANPFFFTQIDLVQVKFVTSVEDGCCPFKIVFDEDFYVLFICILLCFKCVLGSA